MRVIDLFAGCGGLSQGFINAGFDVVAAFDNWDAAIKIYEQNFDHPVHKFDLSETKKLRLLQSYEPQVIIGGPPCQDFSSAGKRDETGGRADLTISYAEIIKKLKPSYFLMENVARILKSKTLPEAIKIFKKAGYGLTYKVLDASYCGVPQARKRFIMIGELGGDDETLDYYFEKNLSDKPMTIRDYLGDEIDVVCYYRHPRNYSRRGIYSIDEPSPTIRGVNRPLPSGYKGHNADSAPVSKKIRPLTELERSRVQTFPKDFIWEGSKTSIAQMLGNAVPVRLGEYVAHCLSQYHQDKLRGEVKQSAVQVALKLA